MDYKSILFNTKSDAAVTIEHMKYIAGTYIYANVADLLAFYRPYSIGEFTDIKHGWDYDTLKTLKPEQVENGQWRIPFPEPVEITFDAEPGTVIVDMN